MALVCAGVWQSFSWASDAWRDYRISGIIRDMPEDFQETYRRVEYEVGSVNLHFQEWRTIMIRRDRGAIPTWQEYLDGDYR